MSSLRDAEALRVGSDLGSDHRPAARERAVADAVAAAAAAAAEGGGEWRLRERMHAIMGYPGISRSCPIPRGIVRYPETLGSECHVPFACLAS